MTPAEFLERAVEAARDILAGRAYVEPSGALIGALLLLPIVALAVFPVSRTDRSSSRVGIAIAAMLSVSGFWFAWRRASWGDEGFWRYFWLGLFVGIVMSLWLSVFAPRGRLARTGLAVLAVVLGLAILLCAAVNRPSRLAGSPSAGRSGPCLHSCAT